MADMRNLSLHIVFASEENHVGKIWIGTLGTRCLTEAVGYGDRDRP